MSRRKKRALAFAFEAFSISFILMMVAGRVLTSTFPVIFTLIISFVLAIYTLLRTYYPGNLFEDGTIALDLSDPKVNRYLLLIDDLHCVDFIDGGKYFILKTKVLTDKDPRYEEMHNSHQ